MKHESNASHKIKVLLADDHAVVRDGLRLLIEATNTFSVVGEAGTGIEAVNYVDKFRPSIVVMDVGMPLLNGIEAARQIKSKHPSTEVIILSMHSSAEYVYRALSAGVRAYVLKSSAAKDLIQALYAVRDGKRYLTPKIMDVVVDAYVWFRNGTETISARGTLTNRERQVMQLVVEGKTSKEISGILDLAVGTVDSYRHRIMQKLGVKDVAGLVRYALSENFLPGIKGSAEKTDLA